MRKMFFVLAALALVFPLLGMAQGVLAKPRDAKKSKVLICHITNRKADPYELIRVPQSAISGHQNHESADGLKDIIPITDRNKDGKITVADCTYGMGNGEECVITAPVLVSPANGAVNVATNVTLKWNAVTGAETYEVLTSESSNFANYSSHTTSATQLTLDFPQGKTIYWKVRAIIDNDEEEDCISAYSAVRSFTTIAAAVGGGEEEDDDKTTIINRPLALGVGGSVEAGSSLEGFGAGPGVLPETGTGAEGLVFALLSSGGLTWLIRRREVLGG